MSIYIDLHRTRENSTTANKYALISILNNFEYSAKYAGKSVEYSDTWANGTYINGFHVVGICEVIYCPTIREKSGIFVVPKEYEESVALRYLLVYAGHHKKFKARNSACNILSHGGHSATMISGVIIRT